MPSEPSFRLLPRELGVAGAVLLGLGSIVGTGVYVSLGLAAGVAGPAILLAIPLAGLLALCNGLSSAQLAASHPVSGGTYKYGHKYLNPIAGFAAGWLFLCAKSASAAAATMAVGGYLANALNIPQFDTALSVLILLSLTGVIFFGLRPAKWVNALLVVVASGALTVLVVTALPGLPAGGTDNFMPFLPVESPSGVLYAAALVFVAYTGYGRVATLGEEVRNPTQTIPRAIFATLICATALYFAVGLVAVGTVGAPVFAANVAASGAPLEVVAAHLETKLSWLPLRLLIAAGALAAMISVLLNLILGLSRVYLAMGRRGDLPPALAQLDRSGNTPIWGVLIAGGTVLALAVFSDIRSTWTFSAFTVLLYYALTNLCALRLPPVDRMYPRGVAVCGLFGCIGLAVWIPLQVWGLGFVILAVGFVLRFIGHRVWL